ncbi:MAG: hypothetical protein J7621_22330 [Niastella sp.]|nr:hypothetical protein [Niastella sp.]
MKNTIDIIIDPYTLQELAVLYHVQALTMYRWLAPYQDEIGKPEHFANGIWKFSERQVKIIVSKLQPQDI